MPKNQMVDNRMESYRSFFDHEWAKRINHLVDGTPLEPIVFNLCLAWKGAANTHILPWLLVDFLGQFADGMANAYQPPSAQLISALAAKLVDELDEPIRPMLRKKLREAIERVDTEVQEAFERNPYQFDRKEAWKFYLGQSEFQLSLVASQRLCYAGLFFGYEDFVASCYKLVSGGRRLKSGERAATDLEKAFGAQTAQFCWLDNHVQVARLARNDLVHNGARISPRLVKRDHDLIVRDGELQIFACHTARLFEQLKGRATHLANCSLQLLGESDGP